MFNPAGDGAAFRQKHGLEGKFIALYAGAHGMSNDLDVILQSAEHLRSCPEITFLLIGDGKEKPQLVEKAQSAGLDNVRFLPPMPKKEIAEALAAADACIAILKPIQIYATTYPNKVFDYMAAGRPVILAIDGVIRQVVEDAGAGIAVPPGDSRALAGAVKTLAEYPDRGRSLGLAGRYAVETQYSRAEFAQNLVHVLEDMWRQHG
jgi:glycosyltransferase involved in cell wall biosynthesis